jgi:hypothetical protein
MRCSRWAISTMMLLWILGAWLASAARADDAQRASTLRACPSAAVASSLIAKALRTTRKVTVRKCVPMLSEVPRRLGAGPTPAWVFIAMSEDTSVKEYTDPNRYQDSMLVIGVDGLLLASDVPGFYSEMDSSKVLTPMVSGLRSVDLDGDGYDEVVIEETVGRWDSQTSIEVFRVVDTSLLHVLPSIPISSSNGGKAEHPTDCGGRWSIAGRRNQRRIVVVNEVGSGPEAKKCPRAGISEYVLRNGKLAKPEGPGPSSAATPGASRSSSTTTNP